MNNTANFVAYDQDLEGISAMAYADTASPHIPKYFLISKGVENQHFSPLLVVHGDAHSQVSLLVLRTLYPSPLLVGSVEAQLYSILSGYKAPVYTVSTNKPLQDIAYGKVDLDLDGYPHADILYKMFYQLRNMSKRSNH